MIEEIANRDALNIINAEPGDKFGVVIRSRHHNVRFASLTVQRVLKRDVVCIDTTSTEVRFDKNKEVYSAYLPCNEKFIALKKKQDNIYMVHNAMAVISKIRQDGLDPNKPEDMDIILRLIDLGKRMKGSRLDIGLNQKQKFELDSAGDNHD